MILALAFALGCCAGMAMMLLAHKAWIRRTISTDGWTGDAPIGVAPKMPGKK